MNTIKVVLSTLCLLTTNEFTPAAEVRNVATLELLQHCSAKNNSPDNFCIGYMEAAINFVFNYHFWLAINKYNFPAGEREICFPREMTTVEAVSAFKKYVARKDSVTLVKNAYVTLLEALVDAFSCSK